MLIINTMKLEKTKVEECTGLRSEGGTHMGNIWAHSRDDIMKLFILPQYEVQIVIIGENRFEIRLIRRDVDVNIDPATQVE